MMHLMSDEVKAWELCVTVYRQAQINSKNCVASSESQLARTSPKVLQ